MNSIVVGVDGSPPSVKAAQLAADLTVANKAKLVLVYAVAPIGAGAEWMMVPPDLYEQLAKAGERELRRVADVIRQPGAEQLVMNGLPASVLTQVSEERQAFMLVVGSQGRGPVARLLLGSVADRVAHTAHCPVLIVR